MKYPVGDGSKEDFYKNWYLADTFGTDRDTYFHNGVDINLRTGGDSDLGEPIIACLPGKLVYYHQASHPGSGYGIHHVYEVETPKGTRWIHNAHMQWMIHEQTELSEGQEIGAIGKSGTGYAHLHFSIFKVDPKTLSRGIDTIAKTRQQLSDWWEDPIAFLESLPSIMEPMKNELLEKYNVKDFDELDKKIEEHVGVDWGATPQSGFLGADRQKIKGLEEEIARLKADVSNYKTEANERKKELNEFLETLAKKLFLPSSADKSDVTGAVERLLTVEDQLTKAQKEMAKKEQEFEKERVEMRAEIDELKKMLDKAHNRIDVLEQKMDETEEKKDDFDFFKSLIDAIIKVFNKEKK